MTRHGGVGGSSSSSGTSAPVKRRTRIPVANTRTSAEEAVNVYTERNGSKKSKQRRKPSDKQMDPFNNLKMERF